MLELEKAEELSKHLIGEKETELSRGKAREERLQQDVEELKKKLADAHEVIKSNQEVIEYLNRQLTERELKAIPGGSGFHMHQDTGSSRGAGTGGSALADLLSRAESLGQTPKRSLGASSSLTALGLGGGLSSPGLGSTTGATSMAYGTSGTSPSTGLPSFMTGTLSSALPGSQSATPASAPADALLRGPVAYRRPGIQGLDAMPAAVA